MKTVYISGAITGIENYTEIFHEASKKLAAKGFIPVDPCALTHDHDKSYQSYMREDLKALLGCDCIYMLDNWGSSKGANFELETAVICGIEILKI